MVLCVCSRRATPFFLTDMCWRAYWPCFSNHLLLDKCCIQDQWQLSRRMNPLRRRLCRSMIRQRGAAGVVELFAGRLTTSQRAVYRGRHRWFRMFSFWAIAYFISDAIAQQSGLDSPRPRLCTAVPQIIPYPLSLVWDNNSATAISRGMTIPRSKVRCLPCRLRLQEPRLEGCRSVRRIRYPAPGRTDSAPAHGEIGAGPSLAHHEDVRP